MKTLPTVCRRTFVLQNLNRIISNNQSSSPSLLILRRLGTKTQTQAHLTYTNQIVCLENHTLQNSRVLPFGNKRSYSSESQSQPDGYKLPILAIGGVLFAGGLYVVSNINTAEKKTKDPEPIKAAAVDEAVTEAIEAAAEAEEAVAEAVAEAIEASAESVAEDIEAAAEAEEVTAKDNDAAPEAKVAAAKTEDLPEAEEAPPLPPIPDHAQYLLVGAGAATFAAFRAIKARDPRAKILIVGEEQSVPYMRPPLSKDLWLNDEKEEVENMVFKQYNGKKRSIYFEPKEFYMDPKILNTQEKGGVALLSGKKVVKIEPTKKKATLSSGEVITYDKCLLATGGKPKNLDILKNADEDVKKRTLLFRNAEDFRDLDKVAAPGSHVAIVGGGFLGSELACALGKRGTETGMTVYQIMPENGNMGKVLPDYLSKWTTKKVESEGVKVMTNSKVNAASFDGEKVVLETTGGDSVSVDCVVAAVGLEANTDLALPSGLEVDPVHGGFLANAELEARHDLYVAGDCACFYDIKLGRRRVEHHDHAVVSGRLAGENMAGAAKPYWHQSMFWSDLGPDVGYEAIGVCDSSLPTTAVFAAASESDTPKAHVESTGDALRSETEAQVPALLANEQYEGLKRVLAPKVQNIPEAVNQATPPVSEDYGKGIVFYTRDQKVVGILLWNCFNRIKLARQVLKDGAKGEDLYEVAKMFDIYDSHLEDDSPAAVDSSTAAAPVAATA